jgi:hypothetical protein
MCHLLDAAGAVVVVPRDADLVLLSVRPGALGRDQAAERVVGEVYDPGTGLADDGQGIS